MIVYGFARTHHCSVGVGKDIVIGIDGILIVGLHALKIQRTETQILTVEIVVSGYVDDCRGKGIGAGYRLSVEVSIAVPVGNRSGKNLTACTEKSCLEACKRLC